MSLLKNLASSAIKLGKQAATAVATVIDRVANSQEFDAVIAACVLVANADGRTDEKERQAAIAQATAHPSLSSFKAQEVSDAFAKCHEILGLDRDLGVRTLKERIGKITDIESKARIVSIALAIANADGDFSPEEKAMVDEIRKL